MNDAAPSRADEKHKEQQKIEERTPNRITCHLFVAVVFRRCFCAKLIAPLQEWLGEGIRFT
jgi:hypothetical protein